MLQVHFSSSLRLCVSARDIFLLCRLRDMVPSDEHQAEAAPGAGRHLRDVTSRREAVARAVQAGLIERR
jgi:hypothetical protein